MYGAIRNALVQYSNCLACSHRDKNRNHVTWHLLLSPVWSYFCRSCMSVCIEANAADYRCHTLYVLHVLELPLFWDEAYACMALPT